MDTADSYSSIPKTYALMRQTAVEAPDPQLTSAVAPRNVESHRPCVSGGFFLLFLRPLFLPPFPSWQKTCEMVGIMSASLPMPLFPGGAPHPFGATLNFTSSSKTRRGLTAVRVDRSWPQPHVVLHFRFQRRASEKCVRNLVPISAHRREKSSGSELPFWWHAKRGQLDTPRCQGAIVSRGELQRPTNATGRSHVSVTDGPVILWTVSCVRTPTDPRGVLEPEAEGDRDVDGKGLNNPCLCFSFLFSFFFFFAGSLDRGLRGRPRACGLPFPRGVLLLQAPSLRKVRTDGAGGSTGLKEVPMSDLTRVSHPPVRLRSAESCFRFSSLKFAHSIHLPTSS